MKKNLNIFSVNLIIISSILLSGCNIADNSQAQNDQTETHKELISGISQNEDSTITKSGSYTFSGKINPITINASKQDDIEIILNNVEITSNTQSPIYVQEAKNVTIILAKNSINKITDNRTKEEDIEDFPNAAIYSMSDLKIKGESGSKLIAIGNLNDGITSKDDLRLKEVNIEVEAKDDGIRGKDSLKISEANLNIISGGDGLKSDNAADVEKGVITIEESKIKISAGDDGIDAVQKIEFLSGETNIIKSYEGVEALNIAIYDGTLNIKSEDDGINVAETSDDQKESFFTFNKKGGGHEVVDGIVEIVGGITTINANGDGFDSNGNAKMTGGTLIINGPTANNNGPIDINGSFEISGGTLMAIGSSGMAETPSENSSQYSLQINFENSQAAGTEIIIKNNEEKELGKLISEKEFQSITFSSPDLKQNETYSILINKEIHSSIKLVDKVTIEGSQFKQGPGMRGGRRGERQ